MRRWPRSRKTISGITSRMMAQMITMVMMPPALPSVLEKIACGRPAMMFAKMISDMPLPIPRWVMSSPIHMISMAPAVSVPTIMRSKMISGAPAPLKLMPKLLKRKR